jgi:hypothetical protein
MVQRNGIIGAFLCEQPGLLKRMTMMMIISPFGQLGL